MIEVTLKEPEALDIKVSEASEVEIHAEGEFIPERNYPRLFNKPKINGVEVEGDKSLSEYGLHEEIKASIDDPKKTLSDEQKAQVRCKIGTTDGTWTSMPDKPFGESGFAYELPVDTSQCVTISSQPLEILGGVAFTFVKVSDRLSSVNEIIGADVSAIANGSVIDFVVDESHIGEISNGFIIIYTNNAFLPACLNVTSVGTVTIPTAAVTDEDLVLNATEKGLYLLHMEGMGQVNYISKSEIKKIDARYLPSSVDIVIATWNEETEEITVSEEELQKIINYDGKQPMYMRVEPLNWYYQYQGECIFTHVYDTQSVGSLLVNLEDGTTLITDKEFVSFDDTIEELDGTWGIPSTIAVENALKKKADLVDGKVPESQLPKMATDWESLEGKPFGEELVEGEMLYGKQGIEVKNFDLYLEIKKLTPKIRIYINGVVYDFVDWQIVGGRYESSSNGLTVSQQITETMMQIPLENGFYDIKVYYIELGTKTLDEKFLPESVKKQADYLQNDETQADYIKNRPFYEYSNSIELPSDISGLTTVSSQPLEGFDGMSFTFVKASDSYYNSADEIIGSKIKLDYSGTMVTFVVEESHINDLGNGFGVLIMENGFFPLIMSVSSVGTSTFPAADMLGEDMIFDVTETGIYFLYLEGMGITKSLSKSGVKQIDSKYINVEEIAQRVAEILKGSA